MGWMMREVTSDSLVCATSIAGAMSMRAADAKAIELRERKISNRNANRAFKSFFIACSRLSSARIELSPGRGTSCYCCNLRARPKMRSRATKRRTGVPKNLRRIMLGGYYLVNV